MESTTNRRTLLKWLTGLLATFCAAILAVPGLRYSLAALREKKRPSEAVKHRVFALNNLVRDRPTQVPVTGTRQDAWTTYPEQTIGRLWLVRRSGDDVSPAETKIEVLTAECPHMGCVVQLAASGDRFVCPCHKANFDLTGKRLPGPEGEENPSLRDMDMLTYEVVLDAESNQWWVEVPFQRFKAGQAEKIAQGA